MTVSDWVLILTTLFLGAVAIWGEKLRQWLARPRATVVFQEETPYCLKAFYRNPDRTINEPVFFFRFMAVNKGSSPLGGLEAKLDQLWVYDSAGHPRQLPGFIEVSLVWATPHQTTIDLYPQRKAYCNIGHIASAVYQEQAESKLFNDIPGTGGKGLRFLFELGEFPHHQPNCLLPGRYAVRILLYAANAPTQTLWFEVAWSGKWQPEEPEMFRELVVSQISGIQ